MESFDAVLRRLKDALGVKDDQDVARALGMNKAAFSARKSRGSFPNDLVHALASRRPELGLDVPFVLTGKTAGEAAAALAAGPAAEQARAMLRMHQPGVAEPQQAWLTESTASYAPTLAQALAQCSDDDLVLLHALALRLIQAPDTGKSKKG